MLAKIKWIIACMFLLVACSSKEVVNKKEDLVQITKNMNGVDNYTLRVSTTTYLKVEGAEIEESQQESIQDMKISNNEAIIKNTFISEGQENVQEGYYKDGYIYFDTGVKVKEKIDLDSILSINTDELLDIDSIERAYEKDGFIYLEYTEEKMNELYGAINDLFYLDESMILDSKYEYKLKASDYVDYEESIIEITYKISETEKLTYSTKIISEFSDYNKTEVIAPENLDEYIALDADETNTESVQVLLTEILNYRVEGNRYILDFNDNETYTFDFDNKIFTYKEGATSASYNWNEDVVTSGTCSLDYTTNTEAGTCDKDTLEFMETTKTNLEIELIQIDKQMSDLLLN